MQKFVRIKFTRPDQTERSELWTRFSDDNLQAIANTVLGGMSDTRHFSEGRVQDLVATAGHVYISF